MTDVAVIIVCYNARPYIDDCLQSLRASDDPGVNMHVVVVENASPNSVAEYVRTQYPWVHVVEPESNLGFSGGNNFGWNYAEKTFHELSYVYLLNQDTIVQSGFLAAAVEQMQAHPDAGAGQSKLCLHPDTTRLNTAGNVSHYLGFGFVTGYGREDTGQYDQVRAIDFPSGAGMIARTADLHVLGLFEDDMFMYLEDSDLGWKLRQAGRKVIFIPQSVVYHKYTFSSTVRSYEYLERNRWWLLLVYYKWRTLLVLLPALVVMELAQFVFALLRGMAGAKLRAWAWFMSPGNMRSIRHLRRAAQRRRTLGDRQFMGGFAGRIDAPQLRSAMLDYVVNPIFAAYWGIVRHLIWW